jgi:transposase
LRGTELLTVSLVDGSINSDVFRAWVERELPPKLTDRSVIIMDNAAFHKRHDIQEIIITQLAAY